jgi:hypothetical protein
MIKLSVRLHDMKRILRKIFFFYFLIAFHKTVKINKHIPCNKFLRRGHSGQIDNVYYLSCAKIYPGSVVLNCADESEEMRPMDEIASDVLRILKEQFNIDI